MASAENPTGESMGQITGHPGRQHVPCCCCSTYSVWCVGMADASIRAVVVCLSVVLCYLP